MTEAADGVGPEDRWLLVPIGTTSSLPSAQADGLHVQVLAASEMASNASFLHRAATSQPMNEDVFQLRLGNVLQRW